MIRRWIALAALGLAGAALAAPPAGFVSKAPDILVHQASGTEFPREIAGFVRADAHPFDPSGHDIVIAYRQAIDGHPVAANIAMIHIVEMTPKEHYLGMKGTVGTFFRGLPFTDIEPQGEGPFDPPGMAPGSGFQGRFRAMQDGTPYELSLSTVKLGQWDIRLTAAYPEAAAPAAREHILALVAELQKTAPKPRR
jgi:hypothetical protein